VINIYSIKEVIEASNNILNRTKSKTEVTSTKSYTKNNILMKKNKALILTDIVSDENQPKTNIIKSDLKKNPNEKKILKIIKNDKLVNQLYLKFNKKIKKNTLKLIFELQKEVSNLNKVKDFLKVSNKQIKRQLNDLNIEFKAINISKKKLEDDKIILNKKITELSNTLATSENEITNLRENKLRLENDLKDKLLLENKIIKLSDNLNNSEKEIKSLNENKIELEKEISNYKIKEKISSKKIYDISEVESKNKFFQEENLRIGSELLEIKKKHDILKKEIEKYENQKSKLISKINSVNEALSDTNILTNVFENKVENKVKVIDHNKIETKNSLDLNEQVKSIFSDKS
tara:strand:- start:933 stop:1973 length:1041 start_codon:yes stop_codon:yes gene_type:complete